MRGERQLVRPGEYLVGRACLRLPQDIREGSTGSGRPSCPPSCMIPQIRPAARRAVRMLGYAADLSGARS